MSSILIASKTDPKGLDAKRENSFAVVVTKQIFPSDETRLSMRIYEDGSDLVAGSCFFVLFFFVLFVDGIVGRSIRFKVVVSDVSSTDRIVYKQSQPQSMSRRASSLVLSSSAFRACLTDENIWVEYWSKILDAGSSGSGILPNAAMSRSRKRIDDAWKARSSE